MQLIAQYTPPLFAKFNDLFTPRCIIVREVWQMLLSCVARVERVTDSGRKSDAHRFEVRDAPQPRHMFWPRRCSATELTAGVCPFSLVLHLSGE